ncbi:MAG: 4-hydroxy-2-oxovalerate aldolase [Pseudomonadota bacterium]
MATMPKNIKILDVTIRDGSYAINYQYTPEQVAQIAQALDQAGIHYIEVSHGCGLGASENLGLPAAATDQEYVQAAKKSVKKAKIGVIAGTPPLTFPKDIDTIKNDADFIRIAANCDEVQIAEENINYAQKNGLTCFFQMMRSSRISLPKLIAQTKIVEKMGAQVAYVVDTAGYFTPDQIEKIISELKAKLKIKIGFHAHNNLGLAIANTLAAVRAGCDFIDASLLGMGRQAGNAQLEAVVSLMQRQGLLKNINLDLLLETAEKYLVPIMPARKGLARLDLITADTNIDLYPLDLFQIVAQELKIDLTKLIRHLSTHKNMTEVKPEHLIKTIKHFGGNPQKILGKYGIPI